MPLFQYKAFQAAGGIAEGQIEASGRADAFRQMEEKGLKPISLSEQAAKAGGKPGAAAGAGESEGFSFKLQSKKVTPRMLETFTRLLSSLLAAGVPLSRALVILCKESDNPYAQAKWKGVYDSVVDGVTLADSMSLQPETFPEGVCGDGAGGRDGRISGPGAGADRGVPGAGEGLASKSLWGRCCIRRCC